jgi:hypothetical protein
MSIADHPQHPSLAPPFTPAYPFTSAELARLARYRAAVQAGFHTDAASSLPTGPANEPASLSTAPFTRSELARLVAYRHAVAAGLYPERCDERRNALQPWSTSLSILATHAVSSSSFCMENAHEFR